MDEKILSIKNLTSIYEDGEGIKDISFDMNQRDFIGIIGKSGAGKSTLINSILGIIKRNEGEVLISEKLFAKDISFSPQNQSIDWYLNVYDNVAMGSLLSSNSSPKLIKNILKELDLTGKENEDPTNLSGGQLQRVQLARQLVSDAKILIFDEPTSSLDVISSQNFLNQIQKKIQNGVSCIVSSHDLDLLEDYCNKILFIDNGNLIYFGSTREFIRKYESEFRFTIEYNGKLNVETVKSLYAEYDIESIDPIEVTIPQSEKKELNNLIYLLINSGTTIKSVSQQKATLKKIILNHA